MQHSCLPSILQASLNFKQWKKKQKSGKVELRKSVKETKKKSKEIAAKCMDIQEAFARASTSSESQITVNPTLLLKHQDQHQSVSCHYVPA